MITMEWYEHGNNDGYLVDYYHLEEDTFPGCCGYSVVHNFPMYNNDEDEHWEALVDLLEKANEGIPAIITLNSANQKKMIDLVEATPYWTPIHEKLNMNRNGFIKMYMIEVK